MGKARVALRLAAVSVCIAALASTHLGVRPTATRPIDLDLLDIGVTRHPDVNSSRPTLSGPLNGTDLIVGERVECAVNSAGAKLMDSLWQFNAKQGAEIKIASLDESWAVIELDEGALEYVNPHIDEDTYDGRPQSLQSVTNGRKAKIQKGKASVAPLGRGFVATINGDKLEVTVKGKEVEDSADQVKLIQDLGNGQKLEIPLKSGESGFVYWK